MARFLIFLGQTLMATDRMTIKIGVSFDKLAEQLRQLKIQFGDGKLSLEHLARLLVMREAVRHYGIPSSDIRKVILRPNEYPLVQLWNWRKIEIQMEHE